MSIIVVTCFTYVPWGRAGLFRIGRDFYRGEYGDFQFYQTDDFFTSLSLIFVILKAQLRIIILLLSGL